MIDKSEYKLMEFDPTIKAGKKVYPARIEVACSPWMLKDFVEGLRGRKMCDQDLKHIVQSGHDNTLFTTLPKDFFFPFNWNERPDLNKVTNNTYGIHWWKMSWK